MRREEFMRHRRHGANGRNASARAMPQREFVRRVCTASIIVVAILGITSLVWLSIKVVLLFLASVLVGLFLRMTADLVGRATNLRHRGAFVATICGLACFWTLVGWLLAAPISAQVNDLIAQLPNAMTHGEDFLSQYSWGQALLANLKHGQGWLSQPGQLVQRISAVFSLSLQGIADVLLILFAGFFLALQPELYINGALRLVPVSKREKGREVLYDVGTALRRWLLGQMVSMVVIGVLSWVGLSLLGVPAAGMLGILAGLLDFVAVAGTFASALISCLFALLKSPSCALYVLCLFGCLHLLEQQLLIPLIQKRAAHLPPVVTVFSMMLFYTLFGFDGLLLAVPLMTVLLVVIRSLYVEQVIERAGPATERYNGTPAG